MTEPLARQTITALETALETSKKLIQRLETELSGQAAWVEAAVRDYERLSAALRHHGRKNLSWEDTVSESISVMDEKASPERAESSMTRILRLEEAIRGVISTADCYPGAGRPGSRYRVLQLSEEKLNSMRLLLGMEPTIENGAQASERSEEARG
jgi:hypothetical protein